MRRVMVVAMLVALVGAGMSGGASGVQMTHEIRWIDQTGTPGTDQKPTVAVSADGTNYLGYAAPSPDGKTHARVEHRDAKGAVISSKDIEFSTEVLRVLLSLLLPAIEKVRDAAARFKPSLYVVGEVTRSTGDRNAWAAKLDEQLNVVWSREWGTDAPDQARTALLDADENLHVFGNTSFNFGTGFGNGDIFYTRIDPMGHPNTFTPIGTTSYDEVTASTMVSPNSALVSWNMAGPPSRGTDMMFWWYGLPLGDQDELRLLRTNRLGGPGNQFVNDVYWDPFFGRYLYTGSDNGSFGGINRGGYDVIGGSLDPYLMPGETWHIGGRGGDAGSATVAWGADQLVAVSTASDAQGNSTLDWNGEFWSVRNGTRQWQISVAATPGDDFLTRLGLAPLPEPAVDDCPSGPCASLRDPCAVGTGTTDGTLPGETSAGGRDVIVTVVCDTYES